MEANNKRLSQMKSCLKSLLVVEKTGYTIDGLEKDYKDMVGKRLESDIRAMGFNSVEEFLHNIPDVVRRERNAWGADVFKAVADASTRHIADLVNKTPASKSKRRKGKGTLLWQGKPKQWQRSQIRSYGPPRQYSNRRIGSSYGMDDDDIGGYNRFNENRFFDEDDDKFADEDMMNYKKNYIPVVTEKRSVTNNVPAKTVDQCVEAVSKQCVDKLNIQEEMKELNIQKEMKELNIQEEMKESSDQEMMVCRIEQLLTGKKDGIYSSFIEKQYEKKYKEKLPSSWWVKMKSMNVVQVEPLSAGSNIMIIFPTPLLDNLKLNQDPNNDVPAKSAAHCIESAPQINKTSSQNSFTAINKEDSAKPPILQGWKESSQTSPNAIKSGVVNRHEILANVQLKAPQIPTIGSYFDVAVTLAVSPQNFTVQPFLEGLKLRNLMTDLNAFYKEPSNQLEAIQQFQVGDYFAASNVGGNWHRMIITKIINSQKVAVKYVDFGYQSIIDKSKLRALKPQFLQLPIQAINASLAGADQGNQEAGQAWTLDDKVWFNQRVVGRHFVSVVKDVKTKPDGLVVVDLELINTSHPSQDTYIVQQLFERF